MSADWNVSAPWGLGLEEEVMLLEPGTGRLAQVSGAVLPRLEEQLGDRVCSETHQGVVELVTAPHPDVGAATRELAETRVAVEAALAREHLVVAAAGTHPTTSWQETGVSEAERHQLVLTTMGGLARREPTFALHVHVAVPDPDAAIVLMNRLRWRLPLLLALSANSPFWQGRDAGMCSTRTSLFGAFPRTGLPPRFDDYAEWQATVHGLVASGAIPDSTFVWWDMRPQPRFGTLELRVMDAQTTVAETAALTALVQALARFELEEGRDAPPGAAAEEMLRENRFLAARDGPDAAFLDPRRPRLVPVRDGLAATLEALAPHAQDLGCTDALAGVAALAREPGAARQRRLARTSGAIAAVAPALAAAFVTSCTTA